MHTATVTDVWVEEELEQTNTWEIHGLWFPPQMRAYDRACGNGVAFCCCCCLIWRKREKEWETQTLAGKKTTITTLMCVCVWAPNRFVANCRNWASLLTDAKQTIFCHVFMRICILNSDWLLLWRAHTHVLDICMARMLMYCKWISWTKHIFHFWCKVQVAELRERSNHRQRRARTHMNNNNWNEINIRTSQM